MGTEEGNESGAGRSEIEASARLLLRVSRYCYGFPALSIGLVEV